MLKSLFSSSNVFFESDQTATGKLSVPTRSEIAESDTWDLNPLFESDADWDAELSAFANDFKEISGFRGRLGQGPQSLLDVFEFMKTLELRVEQLNQYAALRMSEDSSNATALSREARLQGVMTQMGEAFAFVIPEIQAISDEDFKEWIKDPLLSEWAWSLKKIRRQKQHTLSFEEERILALGAAVVGGHSETFSQLTNVDMKFGSVKDEKGCDVELTQSSFSSLLIQRDPAVRKEAFEKFYTEFSDHQFTLASALSNSVRADVFYARSRSYASALESALFQDDVPKEVYENLISSVHSKLEPLFQYYDLRKRVLKLDEIHHYDTYVPLVSEVKTDVDWDGAVDYVIKAVAPLGKEYGEVLRKGLTSGRWCDRYENKGKRSGAFSYGTYQSPPYIMMNYKSDVFSDIYTLAHEAGHSMHTWYSQHAQTYQDYHYPIFLAEVASTFNEMLLTDYLLKETQDPNMKTYLINRQIDDFRGTIYRQTMFAEFEKLAHEIEESGEALTLDSFRKTYRGLLDKYFGKDFIIDNVLELECLRIPHFYSAFYVYKYATGLSAAAALFEQVTTTGDAGRYLNFLKSGGSKFPLETLADSGVDMRSPAPVEAALNLFEARVKELKELLA
ncbi:MAG: oligoendopeptidase F [Chthoniobacterales bacterium]